MIEIELKTIVETDFSNFYDLISDPQVKNAGVPSNLNEESGKKLFSQIINNKWYKKICLKNTDELIGLIFLNSRGEDEVLERTKEIGFAISPEFRNKKIATNAVALVSEYARENNIKELWASTLLDNIVSQKVLIKNGFIYKYEADLSFFNLPSQKYYLKSLDNS